MEKNKATILGSWSTAMRSDWRSWCATEWRGRSLRSGGDALEELSSKTQSIGITASNAQILINSLWRA